jgi:DNA-binding GntR family transcriptional regulator
MADKIFKLAQDSKSETASLDRAFHLHITELSRNSTLIRLSQTYRVLGMTVRAFREASIVHAEHLRIIDAIEHNFAEEAERQARNHVRGAREMIEKQVQEGVFVPQWVG